MAKKPRSSVVATSASSIAASGTRSKRKASSVSMAVAVSASVSTTASATTTAGLPPAPTSSSVISPALKKRRTARLHVSPIPFPALYGSKEVINLYDDEYYDGELSVIDVAVSPPSQSAEEETPHEGAEPTRLVSPDVYLAPEYVGRMRVVQQRGEVYNSMLTRACVYQQQNDFALVQALESDAQEYFVWMRSGMVGTVGESVMEGPWASAREALDRFRALFLSKTLLHWDERHSPRYGEGGYTWIEMHQSMGEESNSNVQVPAPVGTTAAKHRRRFSKKSRTRTLRKVAPQPATELYVTKASMPAQTSMPPSRLDEEVRAFLGVAIDAESAYASFDHRNFSYGAPKPVKKAKPPTDDVVLVPIPLGKLAKTTIERGFQALHRLHDALQRNAERSLLMQLSNHFYSIVPHPQISVIDSMIRLTEKVEMLVALTVHGRYNELLLPDLTRRYFLTNHLDACYNSLNCRLFPLLPTSPEYGLVQSYMFNSFCCVGNNFGTEGKLITVFRVEKPAEAARFASYRSAPNRRILWHGSRMSNWMGILKHGLLITPAGVPLNGSSLGAGLYFTDKISKAMAYSHASHDRQVFLLSEVALGTCKPSTSSSRAAASSSNVHRSCHGVGRCIPDSTGDFVDAFGAIWPLGKATQTKDARATHGHNEFVVYNTAQSRMRYIVVTRPLY